MVPRIFICTCSLFVYNVFGKLLKMAKYSIEERIFIVECAIKSDMSYITIQDQLAGGIRTSQVYHYCHLICYLGLQYSVQFYCHIFLRLERLEEYS